MLLGLHLAWQLV
jgi:hypothetical protein